MNKTYPGLDNDHFGGMTPTGTIIRDAKVFGLIPEQESCAGWTSQGLQALYEKVHEAWLPYGHLVSNLPDELRERHARIHDEAIARARAQGWSGAIDDDDD